MSAFRQSPRLSYLILHVIVSPNTDNGRKVGFHHGLTVFEMIFYAAELEIDLLLQFFGKERKGFILQAVRNLPTQICVG